MDKKRVVLTVFAGALFVAAFSYYLDGDQKKDADVGPDLANSSTNEVGRSKQHDEDSLSKIDYLISERIVVPINSVRKVITDFESAANAEEATAAIELAYSMGESALAENLETKLHERCGVMDDGYEPPFSRTSWALDNINEYCSTYDPLMSSDEYENRMDKRLATKTIKGSQLFQQYLEMDHEEVESDFSALVANANDEQDIRVGSSALSLLHKSGIPLSLGQEENLYVTPDRLLRVKQTALQMYSCYRFGGCGPNDYLTQERCLLSGQCERGWSMYDYYANTLSPIEFDYVTNIFMVLYNLQTDN